MTEHSVLPLRATPGMPPRQQLRMPVQDLRCHPAPVRHRASVRTWLARLTAFGGAAILTVGGSYEMAQVVSTGGTTALEALMTVTFAVSFSWIALAASSALAGVFFAPPNRREALPPAGKLRTRTALVMPTYHENAAVTAASLEVMARGLCDAGQAQAFEIVVLSDSQNADCWVAETLAVDRLKANLEGVMPVYYRRRWANIARKAGNIRDFIENWGERYDHFIVLDADSMMAPETLVALAAAMEADQGLGILQTVPVLAGGRTLFARLQQFAGRVYGPIVARGVAAWQGGDGNYWGHNAIIRTDAFAQSCGLPVLPGREPLGGPILSHDFVEAALMRRSGWRVEMAPDLGGSWEESPPSLIDSAMRDRRWAQGNLQHLKVIGARGLAWPSRVHLAMGVMTYCVSSIWLLLIGFGFALSLQARLMRPEYFPDTFQLFPSWPHFDSERMIRLFIVTMAVLFLPKAIGLMWALAKPALRRGCGGMPRLLASAVTEVLVSALYAPIMMIVHSRQVYEILAGRDAGWSAQRRDNGETRWGEAWRRHRWHMLCGVGMAGTAWLLSPMILAWLSPTVAALCFAVLLSRASGSAAVGGALRRIGLLVIPEESAPPPALAARDAALVGQMDLPRDGILALATDEAVRETHFRWASSATRLRGAPDSAYLTATEKVLDAQTLEEALAWLDPRERVHVAGHLVLLGRMLRLPRNDGPEGGPARVMKLPPSMQEEQPAKSSAA